MEKRWLDLCRERQIRREKKRHLFDFLSVLSTFSSTETWSDLYLLAGLGVGWRWKWQETKRAASVLRTVTVQHMKG